ncbi:hypothetical protein [Bartonella massiliensis]|uniref:hypothetical protein n=1 Tax=Bartonella massiliensis TaxID=929795 RepID=UPI001159400D|nr:hypothetical protein [Bartonella massiliensis]
MRVEIIVAHEFSPFQLEGELKFIGYPLLGVRIKHLNESEFIVHYERPKTLFYFSPLYCDVEGYYGKDLCKRENYQMVSRLFAQLKESFLI